ncbi:hypothetical protein FXO38_21647 [Capsicum annuum]|uniref:Ubiquitin-like protease family profile domain-containing protein n=1 Tax=Capsicum annuum TaxID=4072 RepID=A0A2G2ZIC5_CAPAN|nr:hypothetical protein FXO38_21647 [Capsicum annuum]KAF3645121.1 hypothetical protein FXO37_21119 [Capsicum annuum]PHT81740.1 hypothetical protein T459_14755 [Capsicum annuum]
MDVASDEEIERKSLGLLPSDLIDIIVDRVTSSIKTHLDTSLEGIMSRITELHKPCDGRGVGIANFKGVNKIQEQNVSILEDEVKFGTCSQICAKLQSGEIDLSTPPDDLLSRKRKWCEKKKWRAEKGKMQKVIQEKNAGAKDLLPFPLVEEFSKSSPYFELQDFGGSEVDEENIDETMNYGNVNSIINNVISSMFAASCSLPASPDVKNTQVERSNLGGINNDTTDVISDVDATTKFVNVDSTTCVVELAHDEQESTRVFPMKSKVSPLKPKGSPMKKIFYYMRKKAKYEPSIVVKFTTTDFVFRNKIDALYHDFVENGKDFSSIPKKHEVEEYIRGFYCDANVPWNNVDYVLFPVYVPREKSELGHWILEIFDFTDWCIYIYDSNHTRSSDKFVQKVMLLYKTLIPYFLKKVDFYLEKGIAKSENDTLPIKMVDELPQ